MTHHDKIQGLKATLLSLPTFPVWAGLVSVSYFPFFFLPLLIRVTGSFPWGLNSGGCQQPGERRDGQSPLFRTAAQDAILFAVPGREISLLNALMVTVLPFHSDSFHLDFIRISSGGHPLQFVRYQEAYVVESCKTY